MFLSKNTSPIEGSLRCCTSKFSKFLLEFFLRRTLWRGKGYVFAPAFWDWPLELRGNAFSAPYVLPEDQEETLSQPLEALDPLLIVEQLIPYYPDYLYFYAHYLYFHPDMWNLFPVIPPWWKWRNWWTLNWHNQWAVWWWYTHPNYPQPNWMSPQISEQLPPPSLDLLTVMRRVVPPPIVTPLGLMPPNQILNSLAFVISYPSAPLYPFILPDPVWRMRWLQILKMKLIPPPHLIRPAGRKSLGDFLKQTSTVGPQPIFKSSFDDQRALSKVKYQFSPQQMQKLQQRFQTAGFPYKPSAAIFQPRGQFLKSLKS